MRRESSRREIFESGFSRKSLALLGEILRSETSSCSLKCFLSTVSAMANEICEIEIGGVSTRSPKTSEIGRVLALQGARLHVVGIELLDEAAQLEGSKKLRRISDAARVLSASKSALVEASRILEKHEGVPERVIQERERLLRLAEQMGLEVAYEADGRVYLERKNVYDADYSPIMVA